MKREKFNPLCICCRNFKCDRNTANDIGNEKAYCSKGMLLNRFGKKKYYYISRQVYANPRRMISCRAFDDMFEFKNNFEYLLDEVSEDFISEILKEEKEIFLKECL